MGALGDVGEFAERVVSVGPVRRHVLHGGAQNLGKRVHLVHSVGALRLLDPVDGGLVGPQAVLLAELEGQVGLGQTAMPPQVSYLAGECLGEGSYVEAWLQRQYAA